MNARVHCGAGLAMLMWVSPAIAQNATRAPVPFGCPVANGLVVQTSTDSAGISNPVARAAPRNADLRIDADHVMDTVWTFNITERRWTRPYFTALIGAGFRSGARGGGTTPAPDTSAARGWNACAGARIEMRNPTLTLRGARGQVHVRADVTSLSGLGRRAAGDTTSQPRR